MKKELIISYEDDASKIALIEDSRLFELHEIKQNTDFVVGDIFVGKIKKLAPNLNAAFVNIGYEKDAFCIIRISVRISYLSQKFYRIRYPKDNKLLRLKLPNSARNRQARHCRQSDGCSRRSFIANYQGTYFY